MAPTLYLFVGYPGAGKTTVAKIIEGYTGAVHIWADRERQMMFHSPEHTPEESLKLYDYLNEMTSSLLSEGKSVIFDTNFNYKKDRDHLRRIATENGASVVVLWVNTDVNLARDRAVHSQVLRNGYDFLMSKEQFDDIAAKLESPSEPEKVIKIDGAQIDKEFIKRLLELDV